MKNQWWSSSRILIHTSLNLLCGGVTGKCCDSCSWKWEHHPGVTLFWCWCASLIARSSARSYRKSEGDCPRTKEAVHSRWTWKFTLLLQGCFVGRQDSNWDFCIQHAFQLFDEMPSAPMRASCWFFHFVSLLSCVKHCVLNIRYVCPLTIYYNFIMFAQFVLLDIVKE